MQSGKPKVLLAAATVSALALWGCASMSRGGMAAKSADGIPLGTTAAHAVQPLADRPHFGKPVSEADLAAWNIDIRTPDGLGLPPGRGSVAQGKQIYAQRCVACHGAEAKGGALYPGTLVGGIGSMYPYAPIIFDYTRRAMPMDKPQTLSNDEVYALTAFLLNLNGLVPADAVMDAQSLPKVQMPNRDAFIVDDRPDAQAVRCMTSCK